MAEAKSIVQFFEKTICANSLFNAGEKAAFPDALAELLIHGGTLDSVDSDSGKVTKIRIEPSATLVKKFTASEVEAMEGTSPA